MSRFDYVTVGHVTVDLMTHDGSRRPGGAAFYSALQAARLGQKALILTKGVPHEIEELLTPYREELTVRVLAAEHTTTLATTGTGSGRRQRVLAWAGVIEEPIEVDTSILHLAPVAHETPSHWQGQADFVGLTPQGLMRQWQSDGEISALALDSAALPAHFDAAVINESELPCCRWLIPAGTAEPHSSGPAGRKPLAVAVTAGSQPTTIHLPGGEIRQVPVPTVTDPHDDLGAGDVFAAAFFTALRDGRTPADAAARGNAAAAVRIAGQGPQAIGDAAAVAAMPCG